MARPVKDGVDYFPLSVVLGDKMALIEAEFGLNGFAVIVKLWQKIYAERGYYCEWTNEVALLFSRSVGLGVNVVSEIVAASIRRGIFDNDIFEKYSVLTSDRIQENYFSAINRRKEVSIKKEYLLVDIHKIISNVNINLINVGNNSENVSNNTQSKVKEIKVNKTKDVNTLKKKYGSFGNVLLTDDEYKKLSDKYSNLKEIIDFFDSYIEEKGYKSKSHYLAIQRWVVEAVNEKCKKTKGKTETYDKKYTIDWNIIKNGGVWD